MTYQAYGLQGAIYDPAAELGDYVRAGANGEVRSVLYSETVTLGPMFRGDISAPETGEMSDEYPYIGASAKALNIAKNYADKVALALDNSLDQQDIFNRLTNNGVEQGVYLQNGKLYINGTYIKAGEMSANRLKGGTLTLGGLNDVNGDMQVLDANGDVVCELNENGAQISRGSIRSYSIDGRQESYFSNSRLSFSVYMPPSGSTIPEWNTILSIDSYIPPNSTSINDVISSIYSAADLKIESDISVTITVSPGASPLGTASIKITRSNLYLRGDIAVFDLIDNTMKWATSGSFTTADGKTVTVTNGIITSIQ
jgi:hypothetical protein